MAPRARSWQGLVFFRHDEVMSYAMARLKAPTGFNGISQHTIELAKDEDGLRRELDNESHRTLIGPGGAWLRQVEMFLARRSARQAITPPTERVGEIRSGDGSGAGVGDLAKGGR